MEGNTQQSASQRNDEHAMSHVNPEAQMLAQGGEPIVWNPVQSTAATCTSQSEAAMTSTTNMCNVQTGSVTQPGFPAGTAVPESGSNLMQPHTPATYPTSLLNVPERDKMNSTPQGTAMGPDLLYGAAITSVSETLDDTGGNLSESGQLSTVGDELWAILREGMSDIGADTNSNENLTSDAGLRDTAGSSSGNQSQSNLQPEQPITDQGTENSTREEVKESLMQEESGNGQPDSAEPVKTDDFVHEVAPENVQVPTGRTKRKSQRERELLKRESQGESDTCQVVAKMKSDENVSEVTTSENRKLPSAEIKKKLLKKSKTQAAAEEMGNSCSSKSRRIFQENKAKKAAGSRTPKAHGASVKPKKFPIMQERRIGKCWPARLP